MAYSLIAKGGRGGGIAPPLGHVSSCVPLARAAPRGRPVPTRVAEVPLSRKGGRRNRLPLPSGAKAEPPRGRRRRPSPVAPSGQAPSLPRVREGVDGCAGGGGRDATNGD